MFGTCEADFGRSYVVGKDPEKLRLRDDLEAIFNQVRDHYLQHPETTGRELYAYVLKACADRGWEYGNVHAGHLIGTKIMSMMHAPRLIESRHYQRISGNVSWVQMFDLRISSPSRRKVRASE